MKALKLSDFVGRQCRNNTSYEFVPRKGAKLDLKKAAEGLRAGGMQVEAETPFLLMLRVSGQGATLFRNARILVKGTNSEEKAKPAAQRIAELL